MILLSSNARRKEALGFVVGLETKW